MRRRFLRMARLLPALFLILAVAIYVRTLFATDLLSVTRAPQELRLRLGQDFWTAHLTSSNPPPTSSFHFAHESSPSLRPGLLSWLWWDHYIDHQPTYRTESWRVQLRPWPIVLGLGLICAFQANRAFHKRRISRLGLCPQCHYDLRATPEQCPECGYVVRQGTPA
jgi:hypothetical protein